jgi:hypothetical protein
LLNEDYKELLQILLDNEIKFLIVGAYAMAAYGYPRATGDFDIWVEKTQENSTRLYRSLSQFGAPVTRITKNTFTEPDVVFQIGIAPRRIDIFTSIDGVDFREAWKSKIDIEVEDLPLPFISKKDLIKNKESTGREKDRLDAALLKRTAGNV